MADASLAGQSGIYEIVNTLNGKRYVGSAKCFVKRWRIHLTGLKHNHHHCRHLQAAWNKYGADAFVFRVVEFCRAELLIEREQAAFDAFAPEYNVAKIAGNTLGTKRTPETRAKIAAKAIGRKMPPRSAEYRQKISAIHTGKPKPVHVMTALQSGRASRVYTHEQRAAIVEDLKKSYVDGRRSREKSDEHRHKIGQFYAKLSDDEVREIRRLKLAGVTGRALAVRFGSNTGTISEICSRKRYRWVSD
jgi:group I intron endonuclease